MSTRYVGTCPVCETRFKVRSGLLVHHGYKRPGDGYIVGDCFAVGMLPHEVSSATASAYRTSTTAHLEMLEASKVQIAEATELTYTHKPLALKGNSTVSVNVQKGDLTRYEVGNVVPSFDEIQKGLLTRLARQIGMAQDVIARMTKLIDTWTEQPLTTLEEETVRVTAEKKAQREAVKAERDAKKAVQSARKAEREARARKKFDAAQTKARAVLDAVDPTNVRAVREAYLKAIAIMQWTFDDTHLDRTELLRSAGLVRPNGRLMNTEYEVRKLLAGG